MKRRKRRSPPDRISRFFDPMTKFLLGLILMAAYLFNPVLETKLIQLSILLVLAYLSGKRIRVLYFAMFVFWITLFQLFSPFGRVLWDWGFFTITEGALNSGMIKGITLIGLVFASLFSVTPGLRFPGSFGGLLAGALLHYQRLYEVKHKIRRATFVQDVDAVLFSLYPGEGDLPSPASRPDRPTAPAGWAIGIAAVLVMGGLTVLARVGL